MLESNMNIMPDNNTPSAVEAIIDNGAAQLQALIDKAETSTADLRDQRATVQAQIAVLQKQAADLSAQIVAAEGPDVGAARQALVQGKMLRQGMVGPGRRFMPAA